MQIDGNRLRSAALPLILTLVLAAVCPMHGSAQGTNAPVSGSVASGLTASGSIPAAQRPYHLPPGKLKQAEVLGRIRPALYFGAEAWELLALWLLLASGAAGSLSRWVSRRTARGWLQAVIFAALLILLLFALVELPIAAIGHAFSRHYGISVEGWMPWLLDETKTLGLTLLLEAPLLLLAFGLMHWGWSRRRPWLWFACALMPLMLLGAFLLPPLVEPLFYTFEPLAQSHPALVADLERVVARTGTSIPPERMFLMKASEKSNGLNAYVSGLGASKRIVVWDTTADRMPADEILFTFGHEAGHYVLHHIVKGLALAAVGIFALCWATARLAEWLVRRCGAHWRVDAVSSLPGLAVLLLAFAVIQVVSEPLSNIASRYIEHEADVYGQEAIHGVVPDPQKTAIAAFNHLGEAYLDDPDPNSFIVFWTYDHPSTQDRAIFAAQYNPWAAGRRPRFFSR